MCCFIHFTLKILINVIFLIKYKIKECKIKLKKINKSIAASVIASVLMFVGVAITNTGGTFFYYQPKKPEDLLLHTRK